MTARLRRSEASGLRRVHLHRSRLRAAPTPLDKVAAAYDYLRSQLAHVTPEVAEQQAERVARLLMSTAEQMESERPRARTR